MSTPPAPLVTALADRYRLERELGHGGMATVYLAEDLKLHRKVAIKVLRPELAAVLGAGRFLAEIRTTANLQHPHILALHDSGEAASFLYYVMPYMEGESLRDRLIREKQLPVTDAVRIASEIASALDYAHRHNVIHRDVKPENILLHEGQALVADFGIALAVQEAGGTRLTGTGMAVGTPFYMSPEQAMAERALDGRSDIYALGCVLFEMLAGEPPFTGPTAQAVTAKRVNYPVPSVRTLRETVPESVDRALMKALAKSPADRFATAHEFAEALATGGHAADLRPAAVHPLPRAWARPLVRWVAVLVVLAAAGAGIVRWQRGPPPALDANLIAIVPFDVIDPALEVWREGVVDLLSRTLDGAGSLRTVSPSVALRGWRGRSDRVSATALARRTGAGLAATGSLSRRGADSVDVRAALLDIERAEVLGEVEVVGTTGRLGELVDSLGLEILRTLSRDRPVAAVRQATIASAPLPALKAFLRGEQFYRRSLYDSALVAYSEAIASDSGFALAWYRMGLVLGWSPATQRMYGSSGDYLARAHTLNHGLNARDSLLIAADSAAGAADGTRLGPYRESIARLEEATRRFPGDPEVWYSLGEARYHWPFGFGLDYLLSLAAFERAIALDPGFSPAYEHVLDLALRTGQPDRALQYAGAATSLTGADENTSAVRLASRLLLLPAGEGKMGITRELDSARPLPLFRTGVEFLAWWPDSNETAVQVLRRFASQHPRQGELDPWVGDSLMRIQWAATGLAFRGHLRQAVEADHRLIVDPAASQFSLFNDPFLGLALLGAVPDEITAQAFSPSLKPGVTVRWLPYRPWRYLKGLPWWAMKGDTSAIMLFARRMGEAASREQRSADRLRARYLQAAAAGYLALVQRDSATALRRLAALPDTLCAFIDCFYEKITEAALLAARGEDRRAAEILDIWLLEDGKEPISVITRLDRARIAERLQDRETALRNYQFVLDAWRRADPELAHYVAEARQGLARLTGEPR